MRSSMAADGVTGGHQLLGTLPGEGVVGAFGKALPG
jgi:hypothetical protein